MLFPKLLIVIFILYTVRDVTAKYLQKSVKKAENNEIYERYVKIDRNLKHLIGEGVKFLLPYVMKANEDLNMSSSCRRDVFQLLNEIRRLKMDAFKFLDATGKPQSGMMSGTINMLGDYDECLSTSIVDKNGNPVMKGQYCMIDIKPNALPSINGRVTMAGLKELREYVKNASTSEVIQFLASNVHFVYDYSMKFAMCAPSGCSVEDINAMLRYMGEKVYVNATVEFCDQQDGAKWLTGTIIAVTAFSLIGLLSLMGSIMDYYSKKMDFSYKNTFARYIQCFSILKNFPKVIDTKVTDKNLTCLFGIRALSLFYIIYQHEYFFMGNILNGGQVLEMMNEISTFWAQIGLNGLLTSEVFFFLGGFLNTFSRMKAYESGKRKPTFLQIIVHRLWRIYPTYIFSMLTTYLLSSSHAPFGMFVQKEYLENCQYYWWRNILFINNFYSLNTSCMPHSWYIAADMQLFFISLFTVPVLLRNAKKGLFLHVGVIAASLTATALWAWFNNLMPSLILYQLEIKAIKAVRDGYWRTLPHVAPYFTGLIFGYILYKWNDFKISGVCQFFGWIIASVTFVSTLFVTLIWNQGKDYTPAEGSLYFTFSKLVYVLPVAWMVVCCARGYGGIINYILSLKIWIPISRMSYMVYLISPTLQIYFYAGARLLISNDTNARILRYVGILTISCLMGLAMATLTESPFITMENMIFGRRSHSNKENGITNVKDSNKTVKDCNTFKEQAIELENNLNNAVISL